MALKIKWNDDRVKAATTAILLISRDRLARGKKDDLVRRALTDFREDPEGYKENKQTWPGVRELGPLKSPQQVAAYKELLAAVDALLKRMELIKRQSNSLLELDNYLIASLSKERPVEGEAGANQAPR
jgi:hypothetical protein